MVPPSCSLDTKVEKKPLDTVSQPLAIGGSPRLSVRTTSMLHWVSRPCGSYGGQLRSHQCAYDADRQWNLQDCVPFVLDDDATDIALVQTFLHIGDQFVAHHLSFVVLACSLLALGGIWLRLCHPYALSFHVLRRRFASTSAERLTCLKRRW